VHWSKYNTLFQSGTRALFLYNALSNALIQVDERRYSFLENLKQDPTFRDPSCDGHFLDLLLRKKILINPGENHRTLLERQNRRNSLCHDNSHLDISVCPTLGCNFRCPYCFEYTQQNVAVMSQETVGHLITFLKDFTQTRSLSITWYGGEPTMPRAFRVICDITRRIQELALTFKEAGIVTNGFLLDQGKTDQFNRLNISNVQITIDGPEEVHDKRRVLADGRPTFRRIVRNIDALMNSPYKGSCNIRVNLDKNNVSSFRELQEYLLKRYEGKNVSVYAGHVDSSLEHSYKACNMCSEAWADFTIEQYRHSGAFSREGVYPLGAVFNVCSANSRNGFVVGPEGELYKCWEDVGNRHMVVGSVRDDNFITNHELVALYSVGTDPYLDSECLACSVFPICGGGCANRRLRAKHFGEDGAVYCSLYKDNLIRYLLEYYDAFSTREICAQILGTNADWKASGYREIHP